MSNDESYDRLYWGPGGIDLSRWGGECARGLSPEREEATNRARAAQAAARRPAKPVKREPDNRDLHSQESFWEEELFHSD